MPPFTAGTITGIGFDDSPVSDDSLGTVCADSPRSSRFKRTSMVSRHCDVSLPSDAVCSAHSARSCASRSACFASRSACRASRSAADFTRSARSASRSARSACCRASRSARFAPQSPLMSLPAGHSVISARLVLDLVATIDKSHF